MTRGGRFGLCRSSRATAGRPYGSVVLRIIRLNRSPRVAKDVDPYGFAGIDHNLFREIPLRALPWVGFDFADNT
jgi:hypothetical protein